VTAANLIRGLALAALATAACSDECLIEGLNCENGFRPIGFLSVAVGADHTCAIREDNRVVCWGLDSDGRTAPPDLRFSYITAGDAHTCGITIDDQQQPLGAVCWGRSTAGETAAPPDPVWSVSAGANHTCALPLTCWGSNSFGQSMPVMPPQASMVGDLAVGEDHGCFAYSSPNGDGTYCWGRNDVGQATSQPMIVNGLVAGDRYTCGLRDMRLECWGDLPPGLPMEQPFVSIVAGPRYVCGYVGGRWQCWGESSAGAAAPPSHVQAPLSFGRTHACGISHPLGSPSPAVVCWGSDEHGKATPPPVE
jgi:hypothetical protein